MKGGLAVWVLVLVLITGMGRVSSAQARDLQDIRKAGVLRHIGVPYAAFITGDGRGLSVELMQLFAAEIGVKYEYVESDWKNVISDLVGKKVVPDGDNVKISGDVLFVVVLLPTA